MKRPEECPEELWRYMCTRYAPRTLRAMFSNLYKPNGKRERERAKRKRERTELKKMLNAA